MHYVVGKGGFGKVWKVELKKSRKIYAMKEMSKSLYFFCFILFYNFMKESFPKNQSPQF